VCGSGESSSSVGTFMSWRIRGLRVTMPLPLGRKSRPTMFSRTDDFPEDCDPTTTLDKSQQMSIKLGSFAYNLRQIQAVIADSVENQVLQLIDYPKQIFTESCHFAVIGSSKARKRTRGLIEKLGKARLLMRRV
jgi:hypothetical protein